MVRGFALKLGSALAVVGFLAASPAMADELIISGEMDKVNPDDPRWIVCNTWDQNTDFVYVSEIHRGTVKEFEGGDNGWRDFVVQKYHPTEKLYGGCKLEKSEDDANWRRGVYLEVQPNFPKTFVEVPDWVPTPNGKAKTASGKAKKPKAVEKQNVTKTEPAEPVKSAAQVAAEERSARAAAREAEFQKKQAEYERQLAEQQQQVADYKQAQEDVARKKQEQRIAAEAAQAEYRKQTEAYADLLRQRQDEIVRGQVQGTATASKTPATGEGGKFQATGAIVATREQAMASLMRHPKASALTDVQCGEVNMGGGLVKWTCWGFYRDNVKAAGGSAQ